MELNYLIHLVAQINVENSLTNPVKDADVNIVGTIKIMDACRGSLNFRNFGFISSAAVYKDNANILLMEYSIKIQNLSYNK
ncbi:NAD-dependent epimerase/dehydratase family protein [Bacillus mycoides]|uniref:NAD-dependent epimerase/dehydratase family protein n=1 Tax=Bacillus mycoides TaxID=1405 RepID=UPI0038065B76